MREQINSDSGDSFQGLGVSVLADAAITETPDAIIALKWAARRAAATRAGSFHNTVVCTPSRITNYPS
jgi:hypothetical protein